MGHDRRRVRLAALLVMVGVVGVLSAAAAARRPPAIPGDVPLGERQRLQRVAEAASVATRVESEPFAGRREVFEFLLDHPEFATHLTRALRLARYRIWREPDGLHLDDGWGATGRFELVYAGEGTRVMYARGRYESRLLPDITGEAVVVVEYAARRGLSGRDDIATAISGFVTLENRLLAVAGRLASAVASAKADKEAGRLAKVFARASRAVEDNPAGVYEQLRQRADVPPGDLADFRRLLRLP